MLDKILFLAICVSLTAGGIIRSTRVKPPCRLKPIYGKCEMIANPNIPSKIKGTVYLEHDVTRSCHYDHLNLQVKIYNVPAGGKLTKRGFHVHQYGNLTGGCESMGPHYNPFGTKHGPRMNIFFKRHVGDLGNVNQRGRRNTINTRVVDYLARLYGAYSIFGKGLVLHEKEDDLGRGNNTESKKTGNAGRRIACCIITKSGPHSSDLYTLY